MNHQKITLRHELIAPQQAQTTVMQELYERQRPLNQSYVRQYALAMRKGEFREGTVVSFCVWQGRRYLINGQHTLHAIVATGIPFWLGIEEIEVESYQDIAYWYTKYDRVNLRTMAQAYQAHDLGAQVQLNKAQTLQIGGCVPLMASGFEQVPKTQGSLREYIANPEVRMAFIREWREEAASFFEDIKGAPGTMGGNLRRAPVMAIALVTYRYTGSDATEFWRAVALDDGLFKNDPRKRLHLHIRTSKLGDYPLHVYSRYVAAAWNADWEGRTPGKLQPQQAQALRLAGTPHNGEKSLRYITPEGDVLHDPQIYTPESWQQGLFAA